MNENQISYSDVIDLGFERIEMSDSIFFNQNGYNWVIVRKDLTNKIYLDWDIETKKVKLVRIDNPKECNILAKQDVNNIDVLRLILNFFE